VLSAPELAIVLPSGPKGHAGDVVGVPDERIADLAPAGLVGILIWESMTTRRLPDGDSVGPGPAPPSGACWPAPI
jgi:hypothetical protein